MPVSKVTPLVTRSASDEQTFTAADVLAIARQLSAGAQVSQIRTSSSAIPIPTSPRSAQTVSVSGTGSVVAATLIPGVLPGDLITAALMNRVIARLNEFELRLLDLETGDPATTTAVSIASLIPPSGVLKVGDQLQVFGRNFGFTTGNSRVFIDNTAVNAFDSGTDDRTLVFRIPATITDVPSEGRSAILTVSNGQTSAERTLRQQPGIPLAGSIDVNLVSVQPEIPAVDATLFVEFELISQVNLDATYTLSANVTTAVNSADWQSRVQIRDQNRETVLQQVRLASGQKRKVVVRIDQIPAGTNGTEFTVTLDVRSTSGDVTGSNAKKLTVGQLDRFDRTITINSPSLQVFQGPASVTDDTLSATSAAFVALSFPATFKLAELYDIAVTLASGATNWEITLTTENPLPILQGQIDGQTGTAPANIDMKVRRLTGATAGNLDVKVTRRNQTSPTLSASRSLRLQLT